MSVYQAAAYYAQKITKSKFVYEEQTKKGLTWKQHNDHHISTNKLLAPAGARIVMMHHY